VIELILSPLLRLSGAKNNVIGCMSHAHLSVVVLQSGLQRAHEAIAVRIVIETQHL
jgi:hypothetical protein